MKLEGSLDAFSLQDIFQLLSFTRKTGGLHLRAGHSDGVVWFVGGALTGASADSTRQALARRLIGAGAVSDDAIAAAVQRAAEGGEGLGVARALLDAQAVDPDVVRTAARDQVIDAVFDLLRWTDGDFTFAVDQHNPDDVGVVVSVEEVVAESSTRQDVWQSVSAVIPSPETVLAVPVTLADDPSLSREEWALLALADGRRSVGELVDLAGRGAYAVVSTLAALVQRGLLVAREGEDHVAALIRRHGLLQPLEAQTFQPAAVIRADGSGPAPAPAGEAVAGSDAVAERSAPAPNHGVPAVPPNGDDYSRRAQRDADTSGDSGLDRDHDEGPRELSATADAAADRANDTSDEMSDQPSHETSHETSRATSDEVSDDASDADPAAGDEPDDGLLGGAHVPVNVVPPRPEPFLPRRQAEFDDGSGVTNEPARSVPAQVGVGAVVGSAAVAADPAASSLIERDPSVNRSLMLRLIAGVRGL